MAVASLWRYAVKGLDRDELTTVMLRPDFGFPNDRRFGLAYEDATDTFDTKSPAWVHKSNFLCAFTANELLGSFKTSFDDDSSVLTISQRDTGKELLTVRLAEEGDRQNLEQFFSEKSGKKVRLVEGTATPRHHFGNTPAGFKHHTSGSIIHIINIATVEALAEAAAIELAPSRFRANLVLQGVPAWEEFKWIGKRLRVGGATLECMKRTVRCEGINVDASNGQGQADLDIPGLLQRHFPQHGPYFGIYARVIEEGRVEVDSKVTVVGSDWSGFFAYLGFLVVLLVALAAASSANLVVGAWASTTASSGMDCPMLPDPFSARATLTMGKNGSDVRIAQQLLSRSRFVNATGVLADDGVFQQATKMAVASFQAGNRLVGVKHGVIDRPTADALLARHSYDGYQDDGRSARSWGYLFKLLIPVHQNRSIETNASFLDANNRLLFQFRVRTKGYVADGCGTKLHEPWPNFNNSGDGLNMFTSCGMTPTGLHEVDLNSPEDEPKFYGPWPVIRFVRGLEGNAKLLVPGDRNGILLHTGEWGPHWTTADPMPDSAGCVHAWPENIEKVWKTATGPEVGAKVRPNTNGKLPYPHKPQGLAAVFLIGD